MKLNPMFKPPADFVKTKPHRKLYIPTDEYPGYNFIGKCSTELVSVVAAGLGIFCCCCLCCCSYIYGLTVTNVRFSPGDSSRFKFL